MTTLVQHSRSRLPVPKPLAIVALVLSFAAIYLKDVFSGSVSVTIAGVTLGAALLGGMVSNLGNGSDQIFKLPNTILIAVAAASAMSFMSLVTSGAINTSPYYVGIFAAAIIGPLAPRLLLRLLLGFLLLNILIQATEYFSQQYFFVYEAADGVMLDEKFFGGLAEVFRAKGTFQGPLSTVAFAVWVALLYRGSAGVVVALFLCAFLASGRLGMLTSLMLLTVRLGLPKKLGHSSPRSVLLIGLATAATLLFVMVFSDEARLAFIASALDSDSDQNEARAYFWLTSLLHYFSFSPVEILVGRFGYIATAEGGTENDFLRLLLDCGLAGFMIYAGTLIALFLKAYREHDIDGMINVGLIVLLMNLFPFAQSLGSTILFWTYAMFNLSSQKILNAAGKIGHARAQ